MQRIAYDKHRGSVREGCFWGGRLKLISQVNEGDADATIIVFDMLAGWGE